MSPDPARQSPPRPTVTEPHTPPTSDRTHKTERGKATAHGQHPTNPHATHRSPTSITSRMSPSATRSCGSGSRVPPPPPTPP
eukprot:2954427-Rhodomonas_salina.4